jgi:hypothetical protein
MNITPEQAKLLTQALIDMSNQYLTNHSKEELDNECMSAGESAFEIMEELGLFLNVNDRFATWNKEKIKELGLEI